MKPVFLNLKSCFSFNSSLFTLEDIAEMEFPAVCDNNFYGVARLATLCQKKQKKLIFGLAFHNQLNFLLYPRNNFGYQALNKIIKSKMDCQLLYQLQNDLIIIALLYDQIKNSDDPLVEAQKIVAQLKERVSHCYLGLEYYEKGDERYLDIIRTVAQENNFPVVVASKIVAANEYDLDVCTKLMSIAKTKTNISGCYIRNITDFAAIFFPHEIAVTKEIYDQVTVDIFALQACSPNYQLMPNKIDFFHSLAYKGLSKRKGMSVPENYKKRLDYELDTIIKLNYVDYFLIVYDYILYARKNNILIGPGRGSVCASLVAYCLGITEIDPMPHQLIFERFLNPMRQTQPDIDIDVPSDKRGLVLDYLKQTYGKEKIALITTIPVLGASRAIKEMAKALNVSDIVSDQIIRMLPPGADLAKEVAKNSNLAKLAATYSQLFTYAGKIAKLPYTKGIHPAGIIISGQDLSSIIPIDDDDFPCCQFDLNYLECFNLYKFDVLALNNLTIIEQCLSFIKLVTPKVVDFNTIDINDPALYNYLITTPTYGLFQLESSGMQKALKKVGVKKFSDVVDLLALYRPGPVSMIDKYVSGDNPVNHHLLIPILKSTRGIIIYQEQIMQICKTFALLSDAQADLFRRAISKKHSDEFLRLKKDFFAGCKKNNIPDNIAMQVYLLVEKFAGYGFNKAHAVAYATLTMKMTYLKYYHPAAFIAAIANNYSGAALKIRLNHGVYLGLKILPPSINNPQIYFTPVNEQSIIYPLTAIKSINQEIATTIINEYKNAKFTSLSDFVKRVSLKQEQYEQLIYSGALDCLNESRAALIGSLSSIIEYIKLDFAIAPKMKVAIISERELQNLELTALDCIVNFNLLYQREAEFKLKGYKKSNQITSCQNQNIVFPCFINNIVDNKKRLSASAIGLDQYGQMPLLLDYNFYKQNYDLLFNGALFLVSGRVIEGIKNKYLKVVKLEKLL